MQGLVLLIGIFILLGGTNSFFFFPSNSGPQSGKFNCLINSKQIINIWQFCNGRKDCKNGSDEFASNCMNCTLPEKHNYTYISCNNAKNKSPKSCLVRRKLVCQGKITCTGLTPCDIGCTDHFRCPNGNCLKRSHVCDANQCNDCPGLDNWNNGHGFKCVRNGKQCRLPQLLLWDGVVDCDDGSDLCYAGHVNLTGIPSDIRNSTHAVFNDSLCFECLDHSLVVSKSNLCDGVIDCPDMSDECLCDGKLPDICGEVQSFGSFQKENSLCPIGHVSCDEGKCLARNRVCDGVVDCTDGSDEKYSYCKGTMPCVNATQPGEQCRCTLMGANTCHRRIGTFCDRNAECIQTTGVSKQLYLLSPVDECNAVCVAYQDRTATANDTTQPVNCSAVATTPKRRDYKCVSMRRRGVRIIPASKVCDGVIDCQYSLYPNDESRMLCRWRYPCVTIDAKMSIPIRKVCNGFADCANGRDETEKQCSSRKRYYCMSLGGTKLSIQKNQVCDQIYNCDDLSDEKNCTNDGRFYCENGDPLFVSKRKLFNGVADCTDWSDECPTTKKVESNAFSSRYELIANPVLRAIVWIMGFLAIIGNLAVMIEEVKTLATSNMNLASLRTNHMLVLNLAVADTLMGIYLIMLGSMSVKYQGKYCSEDLMWRSSNMCVVMGVLVVLSSETSVLTMVLLTLSRLYAVYRPFDASTKPTSRFVLCWILVAWFIASLLALIPLSSHFQKSFTTKAWIKGNPFFRTALVDFSAFQNFMDRVLTFGNHTTAASGVLSGDVAKIAQASSWYQFQEVLHDHHNHKQTVNIFRYFGYYSAHSVCIPKIYVTPADNAWGFSLMITIFNFIAFVFVTSAYVVIYMKSTGKSLTKKKDKTKNRRASKTGKASKQAQEIQRKIIRLIVTDFCCWVPISIMAFVNFSGVVLSADAYAVSAIVLLPINSALNPIVYSNLIDNFIGYFKCKKDKSQRINSVTSATYTTAVNNKIST